MSDLDEMIKMYKEIQENYIKALERENEELRKQKEADSLKIEELEKRLLEERGSKYIKNVPITTNEPIIGPGNGWGYGNNPIWTSSGNNTVPATFCGSATGTSVGNEVNTAKQAYYTMKGQDWATYYQSVMNGATNDVHEKKLKKANSGD